MLGTTESSNVGVANNYYSRILFTVFAFHESFTSKTVERKLSNFIFLKIDLYVPKSKCHVLHAKMKLFYKQFYKHKTVL